MEVGMMGPAAATSASTVTHTPRLSPVRLTRARENRARAERSLETSVCPPSSPERPPCGTSLHTRAAGDARSLKTPTQKSFQ